MLTEKLNRGDTIAVYCGSRMVFKKDIEIVYESIEVLKSLGFNLIYDKNMFATSEREYYDAKERADVFMSYVKNPKVKMMLSVKGGQDSHAIFDYIIYVL